MKNELLLNGAFQRHKINMSSFSCNNFLMITYAEMDLRGSAGSARPPYFLQSFVIFLDFFAITLKN